ncbi:MAG: hypothetical protein JWQ34_2620 [Mucilaginibacter sp.]|uniref:hypothetical protein n=1 Tax=Mucilaginibacter sp. TaxID=1882438 RepID=UPI00261EAEA2|nr:hypothetical protein [Mucilaginibacter sp.]MDB5004395.1 hypothetical protein [Mucilaginibacter sp.]
MKYRHLLILALLSGLVIRAQAQIRTKTDITEIKPQVDGIKSLRTDLPKQVITDSLFDKKLDSVLNTVSGVTYVNGRATQTSASVDDKGLTVNYNIIDNKHLTFQFTGSGTSTKSVVDLVSGGKYSKTLTGGLNLFWFPFNNHASTDTAEKSKLSKAIDKLDNYYTVKRKQHLGQNEITSLKTIFFIYGKYFYTQETIPDNLIADYDTKYATFNTLLKKYAFYLPKDFETLTSANQRLAVDSLVSYTTDVLNHYYYQQELDTLNKVQLAVKWNNTFVNWWLISAKVNHDAYPLYDAAAVSDNYVNTFDDFYPSFAVSYNFAFLGLKTNKLFMPTLKFQNNRDFKAGNLLFLDIPQNQRLVGTQTVSDYKQTSYYGTKADKKPVWNFEMPFTLFFPKAKVPFGFDLSVNSDLDDAGNLGGRFGVYVSIPGAKQSVIIEPLLRIDPWKSGDTSFGKDQLSFGINLTVALPTYVSGVK